jgi:hypothetical protein
MEKQCDALLHIRDRNKILFMEDGTTSISTTHLSNACLVWATLYSCMLKLATPANYIQHNTPQVEMSEEQMTTAHPPHVPQPTQRIFFTGVHTKFQTKSNKE